MNGPLACPRETVLGGRRRSDRNPTIAGRDFRRPAPPTGEALRELRMLCSRYGERMREALASHIRVAVTADVREAMILPYGEALAELPDGCWLIPLRAESGERAVLALDDSLQHYLIGRLLGFKQKQPDEASELDADPAEDAQQQRARPSLPAIGEISRSALRPFVNALLRRVNQLLCGRPGGPRPDAEFAVDQDRSGQAGSRLMRGIDLMVRFSTRLNEGDHGGELTLLLQQETVASLLTPEVPKREPPERREVNQRVERVVRSMGLSLSVRLGAATVDLAEFGRLARGDVLVLDRRMSEPIEVLIDDRVEFLARPGRSRGRRAVHITERMEVKEPQ